VLPGNLATGLPVAPANSNCPCLLRASISCDSLFRHIHRASPITAAVALDMAEDCHFPSISRDVRIHSQGTTLGGLGEHSAFVTR
jgi:hypothetical protein